GNVPDCSVMLAGFPPVQPPSAQTMRRLILCPDHWPTQRSDAAAERVASSPVWWLATKFRKCVLDPGPQFRIACRHETGHHTRRVPETAASSTKLLQHR